MPRFFYSSIAVALVAFCVTLNPLLAQNVNNSSMLLSETQVQTKLQEIPQWQRDGEVISRTFEFADFVNAVDFVNKLVAPAEAAGHHPDLAISYNKVTVSLTTHDAGGLTELDFALAKEISDLAN